MALFSGTADFYRQYRADVPEQVAAILDAAVPQGQRPRRLLDLGTGTGFVVRALLGRFDDIIAVDPDPDMLAAAEANLRSGLPPGTTLSLAQSVAEEFSAPSGWAADLVTICRAFHWLDQARVLSRLERQVAADGAVAIFGDQSIWTATTPWKVAVRTVVQEYLGERRRAGQGTYTVPGRPYSDILEESTFSQVEQMTIPVQRTRTADSIVGYLHSTSFAAPDLFGDRLADFDRAVRGRLLNFSDRDHFSDDNEFHLLIARRPSAPQ